jgi:hypothetical protein
LAAPAIEAKLRATKVDIHFIETLLQEINSF